MLKMTAIFALMFFVSCAWCACDSCGSECAPACGTRWFRACCFNYLRKKRGPDTLKVHQLPGLFAQEKETQPSLKLPLILVEKLPAELWISNVESSENHPYLLTN